jgi:threonine/homoserine/homoserine lactone efflux protein
VIALLSSLAFFPQFLSGGADVGGEIALLSATFLALAILVDGGWALLAARARRFLATRGKLRNRLSGGLMIGAGIGLALARKS